jgi:hypothetical protein
VLQGRLTALASVVMLVALTGGAAGWSVATSASIPDWAALPTNNPAAIASLHQATYATLNSRSFTMTGSTYGPPSGWIGFSSQQPPPLVRNTFRIVYQAPNRYDLINSTPKQEVRSIGTTAYTRTGSSSMWTASGAVGLLTTLTSTTWLPELLDGTVQQWGDTYRITYRTNPQDSGENVLPEMYVFTATVQDGKVVSEEGIRTIYLPGLPNGLADRVDITYSAFGTSPPVTAPRASEVSG